MGKYDWLEASPDIMDALDSAESRAYAAESALAEVAETGMVSNADMPFSWSRVGREAMHTLEMMGAAGGWAYAAYAIFDQEDDAGRRVPHMPELFGVGADALSGVFLKWLAFTGKVPLLGKEIPASWLPHLDHLGDGGLAHWAVVAAQRAGAATLGIDVRGKVGGENDNGARTGASTEQASAPAKTPVESGKDDPTAYMTPDQKRQWERFRPRSKTAKAA